MAFQVDFRIQNTNAEAVNVEIELADALGVGSPTVYDSFAALPANSTRIFTISEIPANVYRTGTVRLRGINSDLLDSLPVSINTFRTNTPITNLSFSLHTGSGGALSYSEDISADPIPSDSFYWDIDFGFTNPPVVPGAPIIPLPVNDPNYKWEYTLLPRNGLTGDQTRLVFNAGNSTASKLHYDITTIPNGNFIVRPFRFGSSGGSSTFDHKGVRVYFNKGDTSGGPGLDPIVGPGAVDVRFELYIKGSMDGTWNFDRDNGTPYDGLKRNADYLSSFDPQIKLLQELSFNIQT